MESFLSQFRIARAHSRVSLGCSRSAAFFTFFLYILHDGKRKIGAIKRNHHLNMRVHFETFMQTFLVPTVVSLNH